MNTTKFKQQLISDIRNCLQGEKEIQKIIIFGSFFKDEQPEDLDIAIMQDSDASYLDLAMKYRKQTRSVSRQIPLDIIPINCKTKNDPFIKEIEKGEIIYERGK